MAKSAQDSWIIKASTFWKLHFLSFEKRAAFWKAALRYEYSDAAHTAGKNKVEGEQPKENVRSWDLYWPAWWVLVMDPGHQRRRFCWNQKQTTFLLPKQGIFIYNLPIHFHLTNNVWFGHLYQLWNDKETKKLQGTFQCPHVKGECFHLFRQTVMHTSAE